jgi:hypothetical protein
MEAFRPDAFKALQVSEAAELKRIEQMNKVRKKKVA